MSCRRASPSLTEREIKETTIQENKLGRGFKADEGKLDWNLIPWNELEEILAVLQYGAEKYSPDNWKKVPDARLRYFAAAMRHLVAWRRGEILDFDSQWAHLAHAACCILFLMWFDNEVNLPVDNGDREVLPCEDEKWLCEGGSFQK